MRRILGYRGLKFERLGARGGRFGTVRFSEAPEHREQTSIPLPGLKARKPQTNSGKSTNPRLPQSHYLVLSPRFRRKRLLWRSAGHPSRTRCKRLGMLLTAPFVPLPALNTKCLNPYKTLRSSTLQTLQDSNCPKGPQITSTRTRLN